MQKGFGLIYILIGILILAGVVGGAYLFGQHSSKSQNQPNQKACTLEAKICPDGSSVGRTGPSCEFAPCPSTSPNTSPLPTEGITNWKTYTNIEYGYSIKYPSTWFTKDLTTGAGALNFQALNDNQQIDISSYKISISINDSDIERAKRFLNYGDAGNQNTAEVSSITVAGKVGVKAVVTHSQLDGETNNWVDTGKSYQILIPYNEKLIRILARSIDETELVDKMVGTLLFLK